VIQAVGWSVTLRVRTAEELRALGALVAPLALPGDVILLVGGLGAGKTTFAQGFARGLGITGPVTSPTFTLVRQYPCAGKVRQLLHADVYRLETVAEIADLGLAELLEDDGVALVEWGDAAAPVLGNGALTIGLTVDSPQGEDRLVTVTDETSGWADRRRAVESAVAQVPGDHGAGHRAGATAPGSEMAPGGGTPR